MSRIVKFSVVLLVAVGAAAQFPHFPKVPKGLPEKIPGPEKLFQPQPAITTSLNDAVTEVPFLDDYNPERGALIGLMPRGPNGTINLLPGLWEGTFRSY